MNQKDFKMNSFMHETMQKGNKKFDRFRAIKNLIQILNQIDTVSNKKTKYNLIKKYLREILPQVLTTIDYSLRVG